MNLKFGIIDAVEGAEWYVVENLQRMNVKGCLLPSLETEGKSSQSMVDKSTNQTTYLCLVWKLIHTRKC